MYYSEIKSRKLALKLAIFQRENTNHGSTGEYFRRPHVAELKKDESTLQQSKEVWNLIENQESTKL